MRGAVGQQPGLPRALTEQARLTEGTEVDIVVEAGCLTIRPRARRYTLDEMVEETTPENRHEETDRGGPEGREVW